MFKTAHALNLWLQEGISTWGFVEAAVSKEVGLFELRKIPKR
jgi:hypothetical protein